MFVDIVSYALAILKAIWVHLHSPRLCLITEITKSIPFLSKHPEDAFILLPEL